MAGGGYSNGSGCKLQWARDVPETIAPLVSGGIAYLRRYLLSGEFELGNAFFSGSMKVCVTHTHAHTTHARTI